MVGLLLHSSAGYADTDGQIQAPVSERAVASEPSGNERSFDIPIAAGQDVVGLRAPSYNAQGELIFLLTADAARKLEESLLEFDRMRVDFWDEERKPMSLTMPKARYDLSQKLLYGNDGALIEREDFRLQGHSLEFDLESQSGNLFGEVTMRVCSVERALESGEE